MSIFVYLNLNVSNVVRAATLAAKEVYLYQHGARKRARAGCRAHLPHVSGSPAVLEN